MGSAAGLGAKADAGKEATDRTGVLGSIRAAVGDQAFERYFGSGASVRVNAGSAGEHTEVGDRGGEGVGVVRVEVRVGTAFLASMCERRFGAAVREALRGDLGGEGAEVRFEIDGEGGTATHAGLERNTGGDTERLGADRDGESRRANGAAQAVMGSGRRGAFGPGVGCEGLSELIVTAGNRLAVSACMGVARGDEDSPPIVYVWGGCGSGKTRLLTGIVGERARVGLEARARYATADAFSDEFVTAKWKNTLEGMRARFLSAGVVCIDDIDALGSKGATQREVQQLIDAVISRGGGGGGRVVVTGSCPPRGLKGFGEALVSRLGSGLVARLGEPTRDEIEAAVRSRASRRGLVIEEAGVRRIADEVSGGRNGGEGGAIRSASFRDVEGVVTRVEAAWRLLPDVRRLTGKEPGTESGSIGLVVVERALAGIGETGSAARSGAGRATGEGAASGGAGSDGAREEGRDAGIGAGTDPRRPVRFSEILDEVCGLLRVDRADLASAGRQKRTVLARGVAWTVARRLTNMSFPEIAQATGKANHSTVIASCQRLEGLIESGAMAEAGIEAGAMSVRELCDRVARSVMRRVSGRVG